MVDGMIIVEFLPLDILIIKKFIFFGQRALEKKNKKFLDQKAPEKS